MKLKTIISAVSFFATLPCALLGLLGGEVVAQTIQVDFGFGDATANLVVCYKGKSLFAESVKICVQSQSESFTFTPVLSSGWHPQISCITTKDGQNCLLFTIGDATSSATHFVLYNLSQGKATVVGQHKIFT